MQQGRSIKSAGAVVAPEPVRRGVVDLVERVGERAALEQLGVGRSVLARVAAGFPVRRAMADVIAMRLQPLAVAK